MSKSLFERPSFKLGFHKTTDQPSSYHQPPTNQPTDHQPPTSDGLNATTIDQTTDQWEIWGPKIP